MAVFDLHQLCRIQSASSCCISSERQPLLTEVFVQQLRFCSMLPAILAASGALAADADNGTPGGNVLRQLPYRLADRAQRRNRRPTI